ncbi:MAG: heparinase II/III family protein, partial [Acidobacteriaceae bacterium]
MLYPEFPESADWLHKSQSQLISALMNGYGEDGPYSEGSSHYWELSTRGLLDFIILSRNLGATDYTKIPAVADRLRRTMRWRLDITAPDGGVFAFGDSDRNSAGGDYLTLGGALLRDPVITWGGRMILERTKDWPPAELNPTFLARIDLSLPTVKPTLVAGLYPLSGFSTFRSSWDANANALFFKFGPTFLWRRQAESEPVISGHAHGDALEFELHYRGIPVLADIGRRGHYENWMTYGGFSKATIGHSTVGLGNPWGYDRLDGLFKKHRAEQGPDFAYERTQKDIGPADTKLMAFGDLGHIAFSSAKVKTYDTVEQQRSIVWLPDDSLTIVEDHMESSEEQPYEWYLTPIGNPVGTGSDLVFGDTRARLQVLPILPTDEKRTVITSDTPNIPPYYIELARGDASTAKDVSRSNTFSMLILGKKAKTTDFLNVLVPYSSEKNPWTEVALSPSARRLTLNGKQVDISGRSEGGALTVVGQCGVVTSNSGNDESYALTEGTELRAGKQILVSAFLKTERWNGRYLPTLNALVSLQDKRASFDLKPWPGDVGMLLNPPLAVPGE